MNLREQKLLAKSIIRDTSLIDAHYVRWANEAYRTLTRKLIIPRLNNGAIVALIPVAGSTQNFYLPYDHSRTINFQDSTGRNLDPIPSEDVQAFGEYNSFGSYVAFYELLGANVTPLAESGATPITIGITNRSKTVTASAPIFTAAMVGEWLLPTGRNTAGGASNPEDYGYRIAAFTSTTVVTLERPFRGVLSDAGTTGDLTTGYFEVRPQNQPIARIWGDPGAAGTISIAYQRNPSKMANDEDTPEETRLSEAIVHSAIGMAGWAYKDAFTVKVARDAIADAYSSFQTVKDFDMKLVRNFITGNPNSRSYSQIAGNRLGTRNPYGRVNY